MRRRTSDKPRQKHACYTSMTDGNAMTISIIDDNTGELSVTNDLEAVIDGFSCFGVPLDEFVIVYRDSQGMWDGVFTTDGRVCGIAFLSATSEAQAIDRMRQVRGNLFAKSVA